MEVQVAFGIVTVNDAVPLDGPDPESAVQDVTVSSAHPVTTRGVLVIPGL